MTTWSGGSPIGSDPSGRAVRDRVVVYEVMAEELEARCAQEELVVRAQEIERL